MPSFSAGSILRFKRISKHPRATQFDRVICVFTTGRIRVCTVTLVVVGVAAALGMRTKLLRFCRASAGASPFSNRWKRYTHATAGNPSSGGASGFLDSSCFVHWRMSWVKSRGIPNNPPLCCTYCNLVLPSLCCVLVSTKGMARKIQVFPVYIVVPHARRYNVIEFPC